jgi:heme/copper-type cytochrome/quinol oxidase subunit 3
MAATSIPPTEVVIGDAPDAPIARPRVLMVGTAFAVAAMLLTFAGLLGIYLTERSAAIYSGTAWIPEGVVIPLNQPNVILFALLSSSVTIQWAVDAVRRDDRPHAYMALGLTVVFGFAVINMAAYLYSVMGLDMSVASVTPALIYTITGAHLVALVGAIVFTILMAFRALGGQYTSRQYDGLSAAALFWHAQVIVYVAIWYAIYITK